MASYDLTTEAWIPIVGNGGVPRQVGLREALAEAHTIREVYTDSPIEIAAIYRLLLALSIRIFPESGEKEGWYDLWKKGSFDAARIDAYLAEYRERFDLLHPRRPFYQHPAPLATKASAISKLFTEEASGNNATLFSHCYDDQDRTVPLDAAARGIVATQGAAIGGGVSKPFNLSHAPLIAGAVFWIRGRSLFEGLLLNAPPYNSSRMGGSEREGKPAWERDLPDPRHREPDGYLDYLTLQARLLLLECTELEDGTTVASGVRISQGDKEGQILDDPLMAYRLSKEKGLFAYRLSADRALWRDSSNFFTLFTSEQGGGPKTFEWVAHPGTERVTGVTRWMVDVLGMATDQAKVELWRKERVPLYTAYLKDDPGLRLALESVLELARKQEKILRGACETLGAYLLFPKKDGYLSLSQNEKKEVADVVEALGASERYWPQLEIPFYKLLGAMADAEETEPFLIDWGKTLHNVAIAAFEQSTSSFDTSARHLRAWAEGRRRLWAARQYGQATEPPISELEEEKSI
ncbi:MAG: CRISPR-associated protein Cse1 [Chlorobi bacterium]|nr:CRISPR-associated protein Cse1 [Chlorobiota bacterium]